MPSSNSYPRDVMASRALAPTLGASRVAARVSGKQRVALGASRAAHPRGCPPFRYLVCVVASAKKVETVETTEATTKSGLALGLDADFDADNVRLGAVYPYVALSAAFMALWVFGPFPGSAYTGIASHDAWLTGVYEYFHFDSIFGPTSLITKYNEGGRVPALVHAVPGAIWCALAPLQLHPDSRNWWGGAAHRVGGRSMLAAASALMVGYAVIDANALFADAHDFHGQVGTVSSAIDGFVAQKASPFFADTTKITPFNVVGVRGIAAWFVFTGAMTGGAARRREFAEHRRWAARHVGAGLWVACQRPVYSAIRAGATALGISGAITNEAAFGSLAFADAFYVASYITTLAYFGGAEWVASESGERERATPKSSRE